eukprot:987669-Pelagomonas_calceolata.AAC.1
MRVERSLFKSASGPSRLDKYSDVDLPSNSAEDFKDSKGGMLLLLTVLVMGTHGALGQPVFLSSSDVESLFPLDVLLKTTNWAALRECGHQPLQY